MNREHLERPFEDRLIRTRRGQGGRYFSYVEGAEYVRRLNDAFDGQWSFEVLEHRIFEREVVVLCKLSAGGVVKVAFGGSTITSTAGGRAASVADDLKAAATDALKKAASLFGLGLHLHAPRTRTQPQSGERATGPAGGPRATAAGGAPTTGESEAATDRQLRAIEAIARDLGWTDAALREHVARVHGVDPERLTKADASRLIDELKRSARSNAA